MEQERPDSFELTRQILARARRMGQSFEVAWPIAVDAAAPVIEEYPKTSRGHDRDAARAALVTMREHWQTAFEGKPAPVPEKREWSPLDMLAAE